MFKRFSFIIIAILLLAGWLTTPAQALYGLEKHWGAVYDENGNIRTDVSIVTVYTENTTTAATVYSDDAGTALTNPITTGLSDGVFEFYSATDEFDILIQVGPRAILLEDWGTDSTHRIIIPRSVSVGRSIGFTPGEFVSLDVAGTTVVPLTASSTPRLSVDNGLVAMEWDDGDESYAQVTFKVPDDYLMNGKFKILTDYDGGSDNPPIHFRVYVNGDGDTWDAATTAQTAVDPAGTAGTPELSTLTVATDFASLAAGDIVTLQIARSDQDSSTADLEVYYVEFYYDAKN